MQLASRLGILTKPTHRQNLLIVSSSILFVLVFVLLFQPGRGVLSALGLIPVAIIGWILGWRMGVIAGVVDMILTMAVHASAGAWDTYISMGGVVGGIIIIIGGIAAGWLGQRQRQVSLLSDELLREQAALKREIAERQKVEEALRESEVKYRALLDNIRLPVLALRPDLTIYYCNQAYAQLAKTTADQLEDQNLLDVFPFIVGTPIYQAYLQALATGIAQVVEGKRTDRDILARIYPTDWGILIISEDITDRKQAQADLAMADMKTELLAKVSHELRTPLNAILGYVDMLQTGRRGSLNDKQQEITQRIVVNTEKLLSHVNGMLDLSQIEVGQVQFELTDFAPAKLFDNIYTRLGDTAAKKGITLTDAIVGMPETITNDFFRLYQTLHNLVDNAIKFTDKGHVQMQLAAKNDVYWTMVVSDTGVGIPQAAQSYIFDAFRQVDASTTREYSGVGLGLSIVKQLVTLMGGEIKVESEVGKGSCFTVTLPFTPISASVIRNQ